MSDSDDFIKIKLAILGGSITNEIADQIELSLLNFGIKSVIYQSNYNRYYEEAIFDDRELLSFKPNIVYIHTNWRNVQNYPCIDMDLDKINSLLNQEYERFLNIWTAINKKIHCPIIQNNFERPNFRLLGNRDVWDYRGRSNFISKLNQKFYKYAQNHDSFYINDLEYLSQDYGLSEWNNPFFWYMYKLAMPMDAIPYVAQSVANIIKSIYGKNKKVLTLDLDNTLWGGVIGDDGVDNILIGKGTPEAEAYTAFQEYCKNLKDIGVVLSVDSKNDINNAIEGLNHPEGILRPDDFVDIKANWGPKDKNLQQIASELSLGIDSFVFVDDNPVEREIVSAQLPDVAIPDIDKVENYINVLDHNGYFETINLSTEDKKKTEMYLANAEASKSQAKFTNYDDYLDSLEMRAVIEEFKPVYYQRIAQLTNKTNQFNLTTLRCTQEDICNMQESKDYICLYGRLIDKFSDNGIVSVVTGHISGKEIHIKLWLMSCRVLKRGLEDAMMNSLILWAKNHNIKKIFGYYFPTQKNKMVENFYDNYGFNLVAGDEEKEYCLNIEDYNVKNLHMDIEDIFNDTISKG